MNIFLIIVAIIFVPILVYWIYRTRIGHLVGRHLAMFEFEYENLIQHYSPKISLRKAFDVFKTCPQLKKLSPSEIEKALSILDGVKYPKLAVRHIIIRTTAVKALEAFRNTEFLKEYAETLNKIAP